MRIPSGTTDQVIFFVAVDSTDLKTRKTGLTTFTVYRARDTGAATAMTTPTVAELSAANMPGVYSLLLDEDMTIATGNDSEEMVFHITQASMAPVTRSIELYRPKITLGETVTAANGAADADIERLQGSAIATPTVAGVLEVDVTHFNGTAGTFASGRPEVNTSHVGGTLQTAGDIIGDTNDIQTRLPAALVSGRMDSSVGAMAAGVVTASAVATGAIDADALASDAVTEIRSLVSGTADSGTTTTMVDAARSEADTDYWKGCVILFTSGTINGQARLITAFNAGTDTITFYPATTQAVGTQTYEILPAGAVNVVAWDNALVATPTVAGVPEVDVTHFGGTAGTFLPVGIPSVNVSHAATSTIQAAVGRFQVDVELWNGAVPNALVSGRVDASVGAVAAGAIDAAAIATNAIDADALATDAVNEIRDAILPKKNTALNDIEFLAVDSTDHVTPKTAVTFSGTRSIDGAAFAAVTGTIAEVGNGIYQFDASAADMNGTIITFRFAGTGADDVFLTIKTAG